MNYPGGKKFAFSIFDDTDNATVDNTKPVYDLLFDCGMPSTKSVWVYPPRGRFTGSSLEDRQYREFIVELKSRGFEIGLHNVGDGHFNRAEIVKAFEIFNQLIGQYPSIHVNHVSNPDNLYWWDRRFEWPFSTIYRWYLHLRRRPLPAGGENIESPYFWGDLAKKNIRYIRNLTFNEINTLRRDPRMPYPINRKLQYSNMWFSSSDGQSVNEFTRLISPDNVDRLCDSGGTCIVYTHFASGFCQNGEVDPEFEKRLRYLSSKDQGWFAPVSEVLDHLAASNDSHTDPGYWYRLQTNCRWGYERLGKWIRG